METGKLTNIQTTRAASYILNENHSALVTHGYTDIPSKQVDNHQAMFARYIQYPTLTTIFHMYVYILYVNIMEQ